MLGGKVSDFYNHNSLSFANGTYGIADGAAQLFSISNSRINRQFFKPGIAFSQRHGLLHLFEIAGQPGLWCLIEGHLDQEPIKIHDERASKIVSNGAAGLAFFKESQEIIKFNPMTGELSKKLSFSTGDAPASFKIGDDRFFVYGKNLIRSIDDQGIDIWAQEIDSLFDSRLHRPMWLHEDCLILGRGVLGRGKEYLIEGYEQNTGNLRWTAFLPGQPYDMDFYDGKLFASVGVEGVLLDAYDGKQLARFDTGVAHTGGMFGALEPVRLIAFKDYLLVFSEEDEIRVLSAEGERLLQTLYKTRPPSPVDPGSYSMSGKPVRTENRLLVGLDSTYSSIGLLELWEVGDESAAELVFPRPPMTLDRQQTGKEGHRFRVSVKYDSFDEAARELPAQISEIVFYAGETMYSNGEFDPDWNGHVEVELHVTEITSAEQAQLREVMTFLEKEIYPREVGAGKKNADVSVALNFVDAPPQPASG